MFDVSEEQVKIEREKARELRRSTWWKQLRNQGICHYCQQQFSPEKITMDHVLPLRAGGKSTKSNIVPSCKTCNSDKGGKDPLSEAFKKIKSEE